jgi:hypothetical protein
VRSQGGTPPHLTPREQARFLRRRARAERTLDMYQAYLRGLSLAEVGALYGLGGERVRQLFFMNYLPTRTIGWRPPGDPGRESYLARRS